MPNNKYKVNVKYLVYNKRYFFMYNIQVTELDQLINLRIFYIHNFEVTTSIAIKL